MPENVVHQGVPSRFDVQVEGSPAIEIEVTASTFTVGRGADNDVVLDDPNVSRHHCRFSRQDGCWYVEDLGSGNGVIVAGQHIREQTMVEGDAVVRVGTVSLRCSLPRPASDLRPTVAAYDGPVPPVLPSTLPEGPPVTPARHCRARGPLAALLHSNRKRLLYATAALAGVALLTAAMFTWRSMTPRERTIRYWNRVIELGIQPKKPPLKDISARTFATAEDVVPLIAEFERAANQYGAAAFQIRSLSVWRVDPDAAAAAEGMAEYLVREADCWNRIYALLLRAKAYREKFGVDSPELWGNILISSLADALSGTKDAGASMRREIYGEVEKINASYEEMIAVAQENSVKTKAFLADFQERRRRLAARYDCDLPYFP